MQWGMLPELHEAWPIDETDLACLADLKAVLCRHGKLDRFAVQIAHRHFELAVHPSLPPPNPRSDA